MILHASLDALLTAFNKYYFACVPVLLAYLLASPASLRLWLATQASPVHFTEAGPTPRKTTRIALIVGFILAVVATGCILLLHTSTKTVNGVLTCGLAIGYGIATVSFYNTITGITKWAVHRNSHGVPVCLPVARWHSCRLLSTELFVSASAVAITASAFLNEHQFPIATVSLALIYNICCSNPGLKNLSISGMFIGFLTVAGTSLLATAVLVVPMLNLNLGADVPPFKHGVVEKIGLTLHTFTVLKLWWIVPIFAFPAGLLITLALRFDYESYTASFEAPCQFIYFAIPAPTSGGWYESNYSDGIVIPSKLPVTFPKVYYTTVLVAWGVVQFTLICVSAFTPWSLEGVFDFSAVAMVLELPVMFVTLMVVALIRGEWEAMWAYREAWVVKDQIANHVSRRTQ